MLQAARQLPGRSSRTECPTLIWRPYLGGAFVLSRPIEDVAYRTVKPIADSCGKTSTVAPWLPFVTDLFRLRPSRARVHVPGACIYSLSLFSVWPRKEQRDSSFRMYFVHVSPEVPVRPLTGRAGRCLVATWQPPTASLLSLLDCHKLVAKMASSAKQMWRSLGMPRP